MTIRTRLKEMPLATVASPINMKVTAIKLQRSSSICVFLLAFYNPTFLDCFYCTTVKASFFFFCFYRCSRFSLCAVRMHMQTVLITCMTLDEEMQFISIFIQVLFQRARSKLLPGQFCCSQKMSAPKYNSWFSVINLFTWTKNEHNTNISTIT